MQVIGDAKSVSRAPVMSASIGAAGKRTQRRIHSHYSEVTCARVWESLAVQNEGSGAITVQTPARATEL